MKVKLKETGKIITGNTPKTSEAENYSSNDIPFIKPSDIHENDILRIGESEYWISEHARKKARILPPNSVLVTCIGIIGKVAINTCECAFNQQINAIIPDSERYLPEYIAYAILAKQKYLQDIANAPVVPIINKSQFADIDIQTTDIQTQKSVVDKLSRVSELIKLNNCRLNKLDELSKSRFVEMFGTVNLSIFPRHAMTDLCEIIDGDRGKNYPKQDEFFEYGYCLFLNAKNVTSKGFDFSQCMFITQQKDDQLRKGKLKRGDVLLTTRGTIGNLAYFSKDIPFEHMRINSGMVILRMKKESINEVFFIEHFKIILSDILQTVASGTAQPQLPINTMKNIKLITPPLDLQNKFADFVTQVKKQKTTVQQSIDKLETLKKSLMQEYFK